MKPYEKLPQECLAAVELAFVRLYAIKDKHQSDVSPEVRAAIVASVDALNLLLKENSK